MADKIKLRRGNEADIPILDEGEPGFTLDTKRLYVGNGTDNTLVGGIVAGDAYGDGYVTFFDAISSLSGDSSFLWDNANKLLSVPGLKAGDNTALTITDTGDGYTASQFNGQVYSSMAGTAVVTGTALTLNLNASNALAVDLESAGGDVTLSLSNPQAGASYIIKIIQDSTTPRNIVWPGTVLWPDGITPVISVGANAIDIVSLFYDGTNYYATIGQNFS